MKYLLYSAVITILVGISTGLFSNLKFFGVVPNLVLLFVIGACLQRDSEDSFFIALFGGLFLDFLNSVFIGSFTFGFLLLALLLYLLIHRLVVFELSWKYLFAVTILATVFINLFAWGANAIAFHYGWSAAAINAHTVRIQLLPQIVYNIVLAYPLYALATWLHNLTLRMQGQRHRII